jgi:UDPglucose 6-dehydrogenase
VVGAGYVGLVTAGCLADVGNCVTCVESNAAKIDQLKRGELPIYEPGLGEIVARNQKAGRLQFTADLKDGVRDSLAVLVAVGTPSAEDGSCDMSAVWAVADQIAECMPDYRVIVMKSTVPVGTHQRVTALMRARTEIPFDYVSNPEFLKQGAAVEDFTKPDRVIIGSTSPAAREIVRQLYGPFLRKKERILFMDPASAEMTKYAANVMLATRVSFMNEMAALCENLGADVEQVRRGIGSDRRIGSDFLFPGVGFGGSCLPKDVRALIHVGALQNVHMSIAEAVHRVNQEARERFTGRILSYFAGTHEKTVLAVWGVAFKAQTDDTRESPAAYGIRQFLKCGMKVRVYDPEVTTIRLRDLVGDVEACRNSYDTLDQADALVIFTDWHEFRGADLHQVAARLRRPVVFDGRNLYDPEIARQAGLEYHSVGRASPRPSGATNSEVRHEPAHTLS